MIYIVFVLVILVFDLFFFFAISADVALIKISAEKQRVGGSIVSSGHLLVCEAISFQECACIMVVGPLWGCGVVSAHEWIIILGSETRVGYSYSPCSYGYSSGTGSPGECWRNCAHRGKR